MKNIWSFLKKVLLLVLKQLLGEHWETTLAGIVSGLLLAIIVYLLQGEGITWAGLWALISGYIIGRVSPSVGGVKRMIKKENGNG